MAAERVICVVIHDVAPATWAACHRLLETIERHGRFAVTLLAVPRYHGLPRDAGFERWLRARAGSGDEVALHGFDHLDPGRPTTGFDRLRRSVYTRGEGEFAALGFDEATRRIEAGRAWLSELGIAPAGFIAPAWLLGRESWRALRKQPFRYTCTLGRIELLDPLRGAVAPPSLACQSQVYSSSTAWRRHASRLWNESLAWQQRADGVVRLELHPGDDVPSVSRAWERLLARQLVTRRPCTLAEVADRLRTGSAPSAR